MARIKYYYDTEKCKYERVKATGGEITLSILGFLAISSIFALGLILVWAQYFPSPQESILKQENTEMKRAYEAMSNDMNDIFAMLESLQERDSKMYRTITGADSLPSVLRTMGVGGSQKYYDLLERGLDSDILIAEQKTKIDKLKRTMYIQTKSYDEILKIAKRKEEMLACMPAIQPVSNENLDRLASGYGMRIHPIYKVKRMHWGVDFAAPIGTPIYATGDGIIENARTDLSGYGKHVTINHGFGYKSIYAHMHNYIVKPGQKIKRGELIGYVGNTGSSTGPHLHYEVMHNNKKVNPVHYFFNDLDSEEYEKILQLASVENQSLS